jgi:hypothetical protein
MTTKQTLFDLLLQQQETINLLRDTARHNYEAYLQLSKLLNQERNYWAKRAEKAENELINLKLFGKKQPPQPQPQP